MWGYRREVRKQQGESYVVREENNGKGQKRHRS